MKPKTALKFCFLLLVILSLSLVLISVGQRQEIRKQAAGTAPAKLLGRVVDVSGQFKNCPAASRYYFGSGSLCPNTPLKGACWGEPDYTITWIQGEKSKSFKSNSCYGQEGIDLPRYTFEDDPWRNSPLGSGQGEEITVKIQMNENVRLVWWNLSTTNGAGQILLEPDSRQNGSFSIPGPSQEIKVKVYSHNGYDLNHLWFYASNDIPTPTLTPKLSPTVTPGISPVITLTLTPTPSPTLGASPTPRPSPSPTPTLEVTPTPVAEGQRGWFQVQAGDVHAQEVISNHLPQAKMFYTDVIPDSVGVVSFGRDAFFGSGQISATTSWLAEQSFRVIPQRTYEYFYRLLGSPNTDSFVAGSLGDGIYYSNSSVDIKQKLEFLTRKAKVIVFVNGDLVINQNIIVPPGNFLGFIVSGNIKIGDAVEEIQGFYLADGEFNTGSSAIRLVGEGIFVANNFVFGRDLGKNNSDISAEEFRLRPDFLINSFFGLWQIPVLWQEIAG